MQKSAKSLLISYYLCTLAPDKEPLKQAGGSESSALTIRISRQNTEIRRFTDECIYSPSFTGRGRGDCGRAEDGSLSLCLQYT